MTETVSRFLCQLRFTLSTISFNSSTLDVIPGSFCLLYHLFHNVMLLWVESALEHPCIREHLFQTDSHTRKATLGSPVARFPFSWTPHVLLVPKRLKSRQIILSCTTGTIFASYYMSFIFQSSSFPFILLRHFSLWFNFSVRKRYMKKTHLVSQSVKTSRVLMRRIMRKATFVHIHCHFVILCV